MSKGTPRRSFRVSDDFWNRLKAMCLKEKTDVTEVTKRLWGAWLADPVKVEACVKEVLATKVSSAD